MIGIAASDLFILGYLVYLHTLELLESNNECWNRFNYPAQLVVYWGNPLRDGLQKSIPWLGISMAVLRLLIVKNLLNPKFENLSNPKFSVVLTLVTYILSTFWSLFLYRGYSLADGNDLWQPAPSCTGFPVNYTEHQFYIQYERDVNVESDCMIEVYLFTDGLLKIIPTIVFPILTGLLIRELSAANTRRKKLTATQSKSTRADHTTKLIVCMTAMFMAAEGPPGILLVLQGFVKNSVGFSQLMSDLMFIFFIFAVLNSITHCLICLTVSTQYRSTVKSLLCCGTSKPNKKETGTVTVKVNASMMTPAT
ncbi:Protein CBG16462 [Caenorhabditis briggsae]|uniref:Protein CBG16462 n=1 Tax=Caenorhabditis briggsae TaxID=6238 RepID=A8XP46_CAEBR|nr:Protein CBG16462 [Caenorhabditis briggsae]CAP34422.2 Protein CBG16462 [Caenorhabditis briggsae]